jgi:DNA mismatch endonuclease (patch repair protein)
LIGRRSRLRPLMVDTVSPARRSAIMANIRGKDTTPELRVRRYLHAKGLRFRLHSRELPGKPDIVFPARRVCVFVHGCFWHGCPNCVDGTRQVKSNALFWADKVRGNRNRDARHKAALETAGWTVMALWECEIADPSRLSSLADRIAELPTHRKR